MTNETKPKIKELLKDVGDNSIITIDNPPLKVKDTPEYRKLNQAIKQLRKENKKLKKVLEATEFAFKMKGCGALVSEHASQLENMWKIQHANDAFPYLARAWGFKTCPDLDLNMGKIGADCSLFTTGGNTQEPKPQAAAHFKCAKTNKPTKDGDYIVIGEDIAGAYYFLTSRFFKNKWLGSTDVLAFSETDPQEIINSLNK